MVLCFLVDLMGFEPTTSRMRTERSPEWLGYIAPYRKNKFVGEA